MTSGFRTVFCGPGQVALEPSEVGPPGPGQVLLRTERTLISTGTELTLLTGDFPPGSRWAAYAAYPLTPGYSSAATVIEAGPDVERVQVGDRVAGTAGHVSHALYPADRLWRIPEEVDFQAATFVTLGETVMGGVRRSRLLLGEAVVIIGAGLLGQLATCFCRSGGAWPLVVIDPAKSRLELARRMGATHTLPLPADAAMEQVRELTKGRMADIVFEITGSPTAIVGAVRLARKLGRVVLLGSPRGPVTIDLHEEVHTEGLEIIGAHNQTHPPVETPHAPWTIARDGGLFLEWQAAGVVDVRDLITHRFPWRQVEDAYQLLLTDRTRAMGVILDWSTG